MRVKFYIVETPSLEQLSLFLWPLNITFYNTMVEVTVFKLSVMNQSDFVISTEGGMNYGLDGYS